MPITILSRSIQMLITLLTPLIIASAPTAVTIDTNVAYNHETQTRFVQAGEPTFEQRITFSGTQTFDGTGRPFDSDND